MQQWFDERTAGLLGGIIGGTIGILGGGGLGGCSALFISKGWKKAYFAMYYCFMAVGAALLIMGLAALLIRQPYHVWYAFLLPGFIITVVFSSILPAIRKRFTQNELTKM